MTKVILIFKFVAVAVVGLGAVLMLLAAIGIARSVHSKQVRGSPGILCASQAGHLH